MWLWLILCRKVKAFCDCMVATLRKLLLLYFLLFLYNKEVLLCYHVVEIIGRHTNTAYAIMPLIIKFQEGGRGKHKNTGTFLIHSLATKDFTPLNNRMSGLMSRVLT